MAKKKTLLQSLAPGKKLDWRITAKKFVIDAVIVLGTGIIAVYDGNPAWLAAIPLIKAVVNIAKNYK